VLNLPRQVGRYFEDQARSARLSQVKFTESSRTKRASLEITLPDRASEQVVMDTPIPFYVVIVPRELSTEVRARVEDLWSESEIEQLGVGYARLELIAKGTGRLIARIPQMYHAMMADEQADMVMDITNDGSHDLTDVEVKLDLPLNWTGRVAPESVDHLAIGKDARVNLAITPPADISPGKYEVRVKTSAVTAGQPISSQDKSITIEILAEGNTLGTIAVVALLLGVVGGIVIYGTRLSRR